MSEDHPTSAPDAFAFVENLLTLVTDAAAVKRRLHALHDSLAAVDEGTKRLAGDRAKFAEHERAIRAALAKREGELDEREAELASVRGRREFDLADREARIAALEREWRFVGEDDDVKRGFRAAQFSSLMKARASYGVTADKVVTTPAPASLRPAFLDTNGEPFPDHTTLTRSS
jgi:hypothetical protein